MYRCLNQPFYDDAQNYRLVAVRSEDIELIRQWRNAQIDVLRQLNALSSQAQIDYFQNCIWPTFREAQPKQILLSLLLKEECIGYGGLTNIEWVGRRAELSFLINPLRVESYRQDFNHFLNLLCLVAFENLHFHRLFSETFAFRKEHMDILEQFGFKKEGILREHIFKRNQWIDSIIHGLLAKEWKHAK